MSKVKIPKSTEVLEELAELEHDQWCVWSQELARKEKLSEDRMKRWKELWSFHYRDLPETVKEQDRIWARKVVKVIAENVEKMLDEYENIDSAMTWTELKQKLVGEKK